MRRRRVQPQHVMYVIASLPLVAVVALVLVWISYHRRQDAAHAELRQVTGYICDKDESGCRCERALQRDQETMSCGPSYPCCYRYSQIGLNPHRDDSIWQCRCFPHPADSEACEEAISDRSSDPPTYTGEREPVAGCP